MSDNSRPVAVVTGGAGFLGSHLCARLISDGYFVYCVDNFITGSVGNIRDLQSGPIELIKQDVSEGLQIDGPVDVVMHFASPASPADYLRFPIETLRVGSAGTLNALELARIKGARFMIASTSESYGDPLVHPQPETYWGNVNPVGPRSVYDEAKRFSEAATMAYRRYHGVNTVVLRIFNTYGPQMRHNDGRAIPAFISAALEGRPISVTGDGSQTRSICYVDDLIEGIIRLLLSDLEGPVNLGNPHEVSMLQLAAKIRDLVGSSSPIKFTPRPQDDPEVRRPDITIARSQLGWQPQIDPEEGLKATIDWFRNNAATKADVDCPEFAS
jgi:dTDP-glucose 4,6-dehydratase